METEFDRNRKRLRELRREEQGYRLTLAVRRQEQKNRELRRQAHPGFLGKVGGALASMAPPPER